MIVHTHLHGRRTGVTRHVEDVARALDCPVYGESVMGVRQVTLSQLLSLVRSQPVVMHTHRNNELLFALSLKRIAKDLRIVFTRHASTVPGHYSAWLMSKADRVIALTAEQDEATTIPHGVDLGRFRPPADRAAAWADLGVGGELGIGVIGRIRPDKGQREFVQAVAPLPDRWRGVLVGLAKDPRFLQTLMGRGITHVAETPSIERWYQGLTIVVQPTHAEGFGLVTLEAMASGCCVVATKLPHVPGLIDHGRTGFLYPPGDWRALKAVLDPLLADPAKAIEVGRAAAEEARRRFGLEHEVATLRALYDDVTRA